MQSISGGSTSYQGQTVNDILKDIEWWLKFTDQTERLFKDTIDILRKADWFDRIGYNFRQRILYSMKCFSTIASDLHIIKAAIESGYITEREVKLLRNIGQLAIANNMDYGRDYNDGNWHEYGDSNFQKVEELYAEGRDFFVTLQDAENAADRLADYSINNSLTLNVNGDENKIQIQNNSDNAKQMM